MIARIWRGTTKLADAEGYQKYLYRFVVPTYRTADGNHGVYVMKEFQGELVHFLLLTFWASNNSLTKYIGILGDVIHLSPDEKKFLVAYESTSRCYEVIESSTEGGQNDY